MIKKKILLATLLALGLFAGGCATRIRITSEPEGALVRLRGEGRAAFRWKTGPTVTPCEMDVYYGRVSAYVIWPNGETSKPGQISGVKSEKKTVTLPNWGEDETIHFVKP